MTTATQEPPTIQAAEREADTQMVKAGLDASAQLAQARPYLGGRNVSLVPQTLEDAAKFSQLLANSELVPKDYRGKPANVMAAILMGQDVGLSPMQALQSIANINGRPSLWGDGLLAVVISHPNYLDHQEYFEVDGKQIEGDPTAEQLPKAKAVARFFRRGRANPFVGTFSWAQAQTAGLTGKDSTPWKTYGARMLKMRARGFAARDGFPDALRGLNLAEEAIDIPAEHVRVETVVPMPQRASEAASGVVERMTNEGSVGTGPESPAASHAEPTEPSATIAPGFDRIVKAQKDPRAKGGFWWWGQTEGKLNVYTFDEKVGEALIGAFNTQAIVTLTANPPNQNGQRLLTAIAVA